jgi:hypothetical protein
MHQVNESIHSVIPGVLESVHTTIHQVNQSIHSAIPGVNESVHTTIYQVNENIHSAIPGVHESVHTTIYQVNESIHSAIPEVKYMRVSKSSALVFSIIFTTSGPFTAVLQVSLMSGITVWAFLCDENQPVFFPFF